MSRKSLPDFRGAFRQESSELLANAEQAILALEMDPNDRKMCDELFRAIHTLKGSAGMVGFEDVATFAHSFETLLSALRDSRIHVTSEFIDLVLSSMDHIRALLAAQYGGAPASQEAGARLRSALEAFTRATAPGQPAPVVGAAAPPPQPKAQPNTGTYRIHLRPRPDFFLRGQNPALLLQELAELGSLHVATDLSAIPSMQQLDPERCYTCWDLTLDTSHGRADIEQVLSFVADEVEVADPQFEVSRNAGTEDPPKRQASASPPAVVASVPKAQPVPDRDDPRSTASQSRDQFLRIRVDKVDEIVDLVGEVALAYASALPCGRTNDEMDAGDHRLEVLLRQLQDSILALRMVPVDTVFSRMKRLVRDLSHETKKKIELHVLGEDTEIDRSVAETLHDPLVHLLRNAVDHGLETAEQRARAGKPEAGQITLQASQAGGEILIAVKDDGRGLDHARILDRARTVGLCAPGDDPGERQVWSYIFAPGFSTAEAVTNISGRGVGMDVVRTKVEAIRGRVSIASMPGHGTTFTLHIPLTLAILDAMLVRVAETLFAVPIEKVTEIVRPEPSQVVTSGADGQEILRLRDDLVPVLRLSDYYRLGNTRQPIDGKPLLALKSAGHSLAFPLDEIVGQQQVVIKPLTGFLKNVRAAAGCALLGSGDVAIVLDTVQLIQSQNQVRTP